MDETTVSTASAPVSLPLAPPAHPPDVPQAPRAVLRRKALPLLATGTPAAEVAALLGVHKRSVYRWMQQPVFAEALRVEVERGASVARRQLGHLARGSVATAAESLRRLEATRDSPTASTAERDRAAERLLQNALRWGQQLDKGLHSGEASGRRTGNEPRNFYQDWKELEADVKHFKQVLAVFEKFCKDKNIKPDYTDLERAGYDALWRYREKADKPAMQK